jgi:hypothetical protein
MGSPSDNWDKVSYVLSAIRRKMVVALEIPELAVVEFTRDIEGHPAGAVGTVVSAHPEDDAYLVELVDAQGRTVDLVETRGEDLRVSWMA